MDLLTFAQFKQVAYKFNFISDSQAGTIILSRQTYKYASYCNLLRSSSVASQINLSHLSTFLENEHLHYFSSNVINYNRIRKCLRFNVRTSALYLTRFWFFLRSIMRASFFIRRFKNVNMGIMAKVKNLTHFSFLLSLGFCFNLTSFKAFLGKGYYMVDGRSIKDGEYGMLTHNSLLSIRLNSKDFPGMDSYRKHIHRFFFSTSSTWNKAKLFKQSEKRPHDRLARTSLKKAATSYIDIMRAKLALNQPMAILRRNKAFYPFFKAKVLQGGFGKNQPRIRKYLNSLNKVFKDSKNNLNQGLTNPVNEGNNQVLAAFSKTTARASIKKAYSRSSTKVSPLRVKKQGQKKITSKPSRSLLLAIEAVTSGFFGDGNRLPMTTLLSNDLSSFKKGLESMPLTLQYFYFNYLRDVEYNLNSYHFFNFTNFRSYNWLITT